MALSSLDKELLKFFTQMDETQKMSLLAMLKTFLHANNDSLGRTNIDSYNLELEEAMEEYKRGEVFSQEDVVKMAKDW